MVVVWRPSAFRTASTRSGMLPIAAWISSTVRLSQTCWAADQQDSGDLGEPGILYMRDLRMNQSGSIGLRSGEHGGWLRVRKPSRFRAAAATLLRCEGAPSSTTTILSHLSWFKVSLVALPAPVEHSGSHPARLSLLLLALTLLLPALLSLPPRFCPVSVTQAASFCPLPLPPTA